MSASAPEELHELVEAGFNDADIEALIDLYDEDATQVIPPEGERASGKQAIRAALERTLAMRPQARMEVVDKVEGDGLAVTDGRWRMSGTAEDGSEVEMSGRGTMVSRRGPDGIWRIVIDNPLSPS
jgi:uncharacterized protein (TIGR02246 family)